MIKHLLTLIYFLSTFHLFASKDSSRLRITEAYAQSGTFINQALRGDLETFKMLSHSALLNQNFENYYSYGGSQYSGSYNMGLWGIGIQKPHARGPVYRLAVAYGMGLQMDLGYYKTDVYRIDTFASTRNPNEKIYIDSTVSTSYRMKYQSKMIQLDASVIWRSNNSNKLKLMGGIGLAFGSSLDAHTEISYSKSAYVNLPDARYYFRTYKNTALESKTEQYQNKNINSYSVYLPMGVDYQLSKKHDLFKHFYLFEETKFRLQYAKVSPSVSAFNVNLYFGFGLRINIQKA